MEQIINDLLNLDMYAWIIIGLLIYVVVLTIIIGVQALKMKRIQNKYEVFMRKDNVDLEGLLTTYAVKVQELSTTQIEMQNDLQNIKEQLKFCIKKVGVIRYQAIENVGPDLSFVIALLDEHEDGVVINGIYSRDGSYTYAKPIQAGQSKNTLSEEELEALAIAKNK